MIELCYVVLTLAALCFSYRLLRGPSLSDRVISIDGLLVVMMSTIAVHAMDTGRGSFIPVIVVLTLVGFLSTAVVARFVEAGGA